VLHVPVQEFGCLTGRHTVTKLSVSLLRFRPLSGEQKSPGALILTGEENTGGCLSWPPWIYSSRAGGTCNW
jgi:hypothetical protein